MPPPLFSPDQEQPRSPSYAPQTPDFPPPRSPYRELSHTPLSPGADEAWYSGTPTGNRPEINQLPSSPENNLWKSPESPGWYSGMPASPSYDAVSPALPSYSAVSPVLPSSPSYDPNTPWNYVVSQSTTLPSPYSPHSPPGLPPQTIGEIPYTYSTEPESQPLLTNIEKEGKAESSKTSEESRKIVIG